MALLADIDAPYAALCALERILADELRHVAYFREVVEWFGGSDDLVLDLTQFRRAPATSATADLWHVAIERVTVEIYVAESSSLPIQRAALEWVSEPALRQVLTMHMEEEGLHAALGKAIQRALIEAAPAGDRDRLADRVRELEHCWRERMWQVHRAAAREDPAGRELGAGITRDDVDRARTGARP